MKQILFILAVIVSCTDCRFKSKPDQNDVLKFRVSLTRPGKIELGEDSIHIAQYNFYSQDNYNVYVMQSDEIELSVNDSSSIDTTFIIVDFSKVSRENLIDGYMVYNYDNKIEKGLFIFNEKKYPVDVDSFFMKNAVKINFKNENLKEQIKIVSRETTTEGVLICKYVDKVSNNGPTDSLILYYSKKVNEIHYAFSEDFIIPGYKLFKIVSIEKPQLNELINREYDRIILEVEKMKVNENEKKTISKVVNQYINE